MLPKFADSTAFVKWLPKAKGEADLVVVLFYGSAADALAIRKQFGSQITAILVGGVRPERLPNDANIPPVIGVDEHGKSIAQWSAGNAAVTTV